MIHEEISGKIIGAMMEMLNELKLRLAKTVRTRNDHRAEAPQTVFQCKVRPCFYRRN